MITALRWLLFLTFILQVIGIWYGIIVLARLKRQMQMSSDVMKMFAERSEQIATALSATKDTK